MIGSVFRDPAEARDPCPVCSETGCDYPVRRDRVTGLLYHYERVVMAPPISQGSARPEVHELNECDGSTMGHVLFHKKD